MMMPDAFLPSRDPAWLALGFRPMFIAAGLFAVVAVGIWMLAYPLGLPVTPAGLAPMVWHAHEMVYGYAMAVIAGFLLTATRNWTGIQTLHGAPLAGLLALWLLGRVAMLLPGSGAAIASAADLAFQLVLLIAVASPIVRARQWRQMAILSKLALLLAADACFHAGALGHLAHGLQWGVFGGLYLVIGLIIMMARRVVPFFIERGIDVPFVPRNRRWVDVTSLVAVLLWAVWETFLPTQSAMIASLCALLLAVHAVRLRDWYTPAIWRRPLLWSLMLGYACIVAGFGLRLLSIVDGVSPFVALHAFAYGGIGMITLSMMSRVSLGHTGRSVAAPPPALRWLFALLAVGVVFRVLLPIAAPAHYPTWILISQLLWMTAFAGFCWIYLPMLARPRVDGAPG